MTPDMTAETKVVEVTIRRVGKLQGAHANVVESLKMLEHSSKIS